MPIYAYRCEACGFAKDVLQKLSDAALTECPSCSKSTFKKQLTAAGFQLKGSGWYVTDFRSGSGGTAAATATAKNDSGNAPASSTSTSTAATASDTSTASTASTTAGGTASAS